MFDSAGSTPTQENHAFAGDADGGDRAEWLRNFLFQIATIVLAGLWIYSPAYHGDWLWDDDQAITANPVTRGPWSFEKLWVAPPGADYFPLTGTVFWMEWHAFGMNPTGYHVVNIVLHILGALAFWRLLHVMKLPGAWLGGMLFAIHPACIESVAWVSELKNTLSQPLFLLACASFVQFDDDTDAAEARKHYLLAVLLYLFAMFAKTSIVTFPIVILAYGWWKHGFAVDGRGIRALLLAGASLALAVVPQMFWLVMLRKGMSSTPLYIGCTAVALLGPLSSLALVRSCLKTAPDESAGGAKSLERYVLYSLPFFWISAILGIATCYFQWSRAIGQEAIPVGGIESRIATAGMAILFYLATIVWPVHLVPMYPRWDVDPPKVWQFLPWIAIGGAAWWLWKNRETTWGKNCALAFGFFLLMIAPVLGFVDISYMRITWVADHFLYLPMIGPLALIVAAATNWLGKRNEQERTVFTAASSAAMLFLAVNAFFYCFTFANGENYCERTLAYNDDAWLAHNRLGFIKLQRGDIDAALRHCQRATQLRPDLGETWHHLAQALQQKGQIEEAIAASRLAVARTPDLMARRTFADMLLSEERYEDAREQYEVLLELAPDNPALLNKHALALFKLGEREKAISEFRRALEIDPGFSDAAENLKVAIGITKDQPPPAAEK